MKDISVWNIGHKKCYLKIPYKMKWLMKKRKANFEYIKDGKVVYLQYELFRNEAEAIIKNILRHERKTKKVI